MAARERLFVQAMTFEADAAGKAVAEAIAASRATDRRVLVDAFSRVVISDHFVGSPRLFVDRGFRREVTGTHAMFSDLARKGVDVRMTNPLGLNPLRFGVRNHKKLIVADGTAWIGGINFSDHNFAWHDLMLRIDDAAAADFLAADFEQTWAGTPKPSTGRFGALSLHSLDGRDNASGFAALFAAISKAERSIAVVSPYPTFPFVGALAEAARRGVAVSLLTPVANNKPTVQDWLLDAAANAGLDVRLTPGMSHLKAMLIDDARLVLGSTNFDFASYNASEEFYAIIADTALVADFDQQVLTPALAVSISVEGYRPSAFRTWYTKGALGIAAAVTRALRDTRRTAVPWR